MAVRTRNIHRAQQTIPQRIQYTNPREGHLIYRFDKDLGILTSPKSFVDNDARRLFAIHQIMRPHDSAVLENVRDWIQTQLPVESYRDSYGNIVCDVGNNPTIAFVAHYDTVHYDQGFQTLYFDSDKEELFVRNSDCLGADNGAGVWMLLELALNGVEARYIFCDGEEIGCQGSNYLATHRPKILSGIDIAISFDRKGYEDIVTHQMGQRTASDEFAESLAEQLMMDHMPDPTGVFTDTNEFADLVPECTNISIGFFSQHSPNEVLDVNYIFRLRDALLGVDWEQVRVVRNPYEVTLPWSTSRNKSFDDFDSGYLDPSIHWDELNKLERLVEEHPREAAFLLLEAGYDEPAFVDAALYLYDQKYVA